MLTPALNLSARLLATLAAFSLCSTASAQALLLGPKGPERVLVSASSAPSLLHATMQKVVAGPNRVEAARGLRTAIPRGTKLLSVDQTGDVATVTLGKRFVLLARRPDQLEHALEQLNKSVIHASPSARDIRIRVEQLDGSGTESLADLLSRARPAAASSAGPSTSAGGAQAAVRTPQQQPSFPGTSALTGSGPGGGSGAPGALSGRTIVVSPGHGYAWNSSIGWTTQRGNIDGLIEDIHTNEIAMRFLIPYLEDMGAHVISCRERGEVVTQDTIVNDDVGAPGYVDSGFSQSGSAGFGGSGYRFATTTSTETASATWRVPITASGRHPVYAWFRAGTNRTTDARYTIETAGGVVETVSIDQTRDNLTWVHLGTYWFESGEDGVVTLSNASTDTGTVCIADAIRIGAGSGSIVRGGSTSGRPRWQESSRYWAQFSGAPAGTVYDTSSGDSSDDVTCRPRFAEWRGADAFISLHTNAGGGTGTSTFTYNGGATAGSTTLQNRVHTQIITDLRADYDAGWFDRGERVANFGEVRELSTMPGMLIELAFHDTPGSVDHRAIHDPKFRRIGARAIARGVLRFFEPSAPFAPNAPLIYSVRNQTGGLTVSWAAVAGAASYTIEQSEDGKSFSEIGSTTSTAWNSGPLPFGTTLSFRVRARNTTGRSRASEVLTAGTSHRATNPELLLVQGFDRLGRTVKSPDNTMDYLALHADAIRQSDEFSLAFDAATNDAVRIGIINLSSYRAIDWACGEESTADSSFDVVEQSRLIAYLSGGGRLLVSGSEIGWDLEANGSPNDRTFFNTWLGADYIADDAGVYAVRGRPGDIFADVPLAIFDNGVSGSTYNVDFPDVLQPFGPGASLAMEYINAGSGGAGITKIDGESRVVTLGFPLETVVSREIRANIMSRALRFLLEGRALEVPAAVTAGSVAPISVRLPNEAGSVYALGASLGTGALPLPNGEILPLSADAILDITLGQSNAVFMGFGGVLDAAGEASAAFAAPNQPSLVGLELVISGLTVRSTPTFQWGVTMPWYRLRID